MFSTERLLLQSYWGSLIKYLVHLQAGGGTRVSRLFFLRFSLRSHVSLLLLRRGKPALPTLRFSCLRAEQLLRTSGIKGLAHFYSAHMSASTGGRQQQENRGEVRGRQISNSKPGLLDFFFPHKVNNISCKRKAKMPFHKSTGNKKNHVLHRKPTMSHTHFWWIDLMETEWTV